MTTTDKPITRETSAVYMGRPICLALDGAEIILWPKGTTRRYKINSAVVYVHAKQGGRRAPTEKGGIDE